MWEQLKKKIMRLFEADTIDTSEKQEQSMDIGDRTVETRISYQYPSDKRFNFPVIPDAPSKKDSIDQPAYMRKRTSEHNDEDARSQTVNTTTNTSVSKKPFVATDVPSPVYGFKNRPTNDKLFDVPAFLRKESSRLGEYVQSIENESGEIQTEQITEDNTDQQKLNRTDTRSITDGKQVPFLNNELLQDSGQQEQPINNQPKIDKFKSYDEGKDNKANLVKNMETIHHKEDTEKGKREKTNSVPFNVVMRPSDKKRYIDKKQKQVPTLSGPPLYLLNDRVEKSTEDSDWVKEQISLLETTLKHFHVRAKVVNAMRGPAVTRFEIHPEPGVKVSKIKNLSDDIKLNMAAKDIRMEAPIPGKNTIGIEVPNPKSQPVVLQEIFETDTFQNNSSPLSVALGLDIAGRPIVTDLKKMPHGLIAGATGSGKSVCINTILVSLLYKASHEDVRFLLIDPKMVELAPYNDLPHLVSPVITDVKAATSALKWAVAEMEERYGKFVHEGARDIERFNFKMKSQNRLNEKLPYIVIVIDELADLMMVSPHDVEDAICRIAQKARACGIHLLLATQRPSVDVITGLIKANIPTRIAFSVSSQVDSRTIIDTSGAEKLLGKGDMLFVENGAGQSVRIQGAFVSDDEIERITSFVKKSASPNYLFEQEQLLQQISAEEEEDELYNDVLDFVVHQNGASASLLQRRFKIGYNRAARLIHSLETNGIISEQKGSKPRDVLITSSDVEALLK